MRGALLAVVVAFSATGCAAILPAPTAAPGNVLPGRGTIIGRSGEGGEWLVTVSRKDDTLRSATSLDGVRQEDVGCETEVGSGAIGTCTWMGEAGLTVVQGYVPSAAALVELSTTAGPMRLPTVSLAGLEAEERAYATVLPPGVQLSAVRLHNAAGELIETIPLAP